MMGEGPIGTFDGDASTGFDMCDRAALITERLHRQTDVRRPGQRGQRVGMGVPPKLASEKAPLEELSARHRQAINSPSRTDDRVHPGCFRADAHDSQLMAEIASDRQEHPVDEDEARC